jgi:hypothetical protein
MAMKSKKPIKISGTFLYFDQENGNDRIYLRKNCLPSIEEYSKWINEGNALGELGFPERSEVSLSNVSHAIEEIHFNPEKNSLDGTIRILEGTPSGQKLLNMIDHDPQKFNEMFVVRSRGAGTINENKEVEDFKLFSFDIIPKEQGSFKNNQ